MELYMHKSSPFRRTRVTCGEAAVKYQAHRKPCMFRAREIDPHTQNLLVLTRLFWFLEMGYTLLLCVYCHM